MRFLCLTPPTFADARWGPNAARRAAGASPPLDASARDALAAEMEEFSSHIGRLEWNGRWCLLLEIAGTAHWFGGEAALAERAAAGRLRPQAAAIADTPGAAWAAAHFSARAEGRISNRSPSCRIESVPPGRTVAALAPLPVAALRLSSPVLALLRELGIDSIGRLLALPRAALAERFAPELLLRLDQATGRTPELLVAYRPAPQWEASHTWESGVSDAPRLLAACDGVLPRLLKPLAERGRGIARLLAELAGESGGVRRLIVGLLRPTLDRRHLLELLALRLETVRVVEPVVGVRLAVLEESPLAVQQQMLFDELSPPIESTAWAALVERLTGRLGSEQVVRIRPVADHDPARAWKAEPWLVRRAETNAKRSRTAATPHLPSGKPADDAPPALPRPTLLLPVPRAIRVIALAPQGHPQCFADGPHEWRVVRCRGPERIETGWWRGPSLRRDYYCATTDRGTEAWIYRDLAARGWYLHGWFD